MAIEFIQLLSEKGEIVFKEINSYLKDLNNFPKFCKIPKKYSSIADFHSQIVSDYPQRKGKYIRPTLVLLTACAMGFPEKKAIKTASAMQVSEDWILNHDDIEDNSLERRGKPALHKLYGTELAINAGDALHILMWKILLDNLGILGNFRGVRIMEEFNMMLSRTVLGQTVEIKWTQDNRMDLIDEDILFISESKTGYYSIAGPMRLGAILGGATKAQLEKIYNFGKVLGQCFQIVDDLLDLTSDFAGMKKQMGNDIYEGKRTIMLAHLLREVGPKDKDKVFNIMKKRREEKSEEEVLWIIEKMKEYGSLEYSQKLAEKLAQEATLIFDKDLKFLDHEPARSQIKAGIEFILNRKH